MLSDDERDSVRSMALSHGATVQRVVAMLIGHSLRKMTTQEVKRALAKSERNSPTKQYRRTKPF